MFALVPRLRQRSGHLLGVFLSVVFLQACGTVRPYLDDPAFQAENLPVRNLSVMVVSDGSFPEDEIRDVISQASRSLEEQVGVSLTVTGFKRTAWDKRGPVEMLQHLYNTTEEAEFDMAAGFSAKTPGEVLVDSLLGSWQAIIDDTYRRYIVVKQLDTYTLTHEICHAFIFSHAHSGAGLMQPAVIQLLPGLPIFKTGYLAPSDREEFLRNKWRDFSEKPVIAKEWREHEVMGLANSH